MKNGKLFGKINVIDFLAIIAILAAVAAAVVFVFVKPQQKKTTLVMKYFIEEVNDFVASKVQVGDELYDDTFSVELGHVTDVELDDSVSYGQVTDGVYSLTSKEGFYSMIITGEVEGEKTTLGAEIGGKKYGVGHTFVLRAGDAKLYLRVYDIAVKTEDEDSAQTDVTDTPKETVSVTFFVPEVEDFTANAVQAGDNVFSSLRVHAVGTVTDVVRGASQSYAETENGLVLCEKEGFSSVTLTCEMEGTYSDCGVTMSEKEYGIGDEMELRFGKTRMTAKISAIGA